MQLLSFLVLQLSKEIPAPGDVSAFSRNEGRTTGRLSFASKGQMLYDTFLNHFRECRYDITGKYDFTACLLESKLIANVSLSNRVSSKDGLHQVR